MAKSVKMHKNKSYKTAKLILLFSVTFVATLFIISALIKNFSPTVDVNIGKEETVVAEDDTEEYNERDIDDRLKWIQFEDNMAESPVVNEVQNSDNYSEQKNKKKKKNKNTQTAQNKKKINNAEEEPPIPVRNQVQAPLPTVSEVAKAAPSPATKVTKVYVGFYPSYEEATEIKNKIQSSVSGYQPFVRKMNNNYVVQIGSFTDRTKAVNLKLEISDKGYPARLLTE